MDKPEVVTGIALDPDEIGKCVERLSHEIIATYRAGVPVLIVAVLEGARTFVNDLLVHMLGYTSARFELVHIKAQSYHGGRESQGKVEIEDIDKVPAEGRDILIADDIYDTGRTLGAVKDYLLERGAKSVKTCILLEKKKEHEVKVDVDFLGSCIEDRFVVGYGLDLDGKYRDLPYVGYAD